MQRDHSTHMRKGAARHFREDNTVTFDTPEVLKWSPTVALRDRPRNGADPTRHVVDSWRRPYNISTHTPKGAAAARMVQVRSRLF